MNVANRKGLGNHIYMEWLVPVADYYSSIRKNEAIFEIAIPMLAALFCSCSYNIRGKLFIALNGLSDLLPTAVSILIGFTVMCITLLLTSSGDSIERLKKKHTAKNLHGKNMTLYQGLHIQFTHSLFSEVILLLLILVHLFLKGIWLPVSIGMALLIFEIYLTLNILLSILRGISNLYFSFYNSSQNV